MNWFASARSWLSPSSGLLQSTSSYLKYIGSIFKFVVVDFIIAANLHFSSSFYNDNVINMNNNCKWFFLEDVVGLRPWVTLMNRKRVYLLKINACVFRIYNVEQNYIESSSQMNTVFERSSDLTTFPQRILENIFRKCFSHNSPVRSSGENFQKPFWRVPYEALWYSIIEQICWIFLWNEQWINYVPTTDSWKYFQKLFFT